jgi:hypothetical protein
MFGKADCFVFTLGLTECWISKIDGAVFPIAPGVVAGEMDDTRYEFRNFSVAEIINDMENVIDKIRRINPGIKFILTVSPVPLIATFEKEHVLTATTYSKSALRTAVTEIRKKYDFVEYFPSYEIITGNYSKSQFFKEDLREVNTVGVDKVKNLLQKHYFANDEDTKSSDQNNFADEFARGRSLLCDEELLDQV